MKPIFDSTLDIQRRIYENKKRNGFNVSDIPLEFCLTSGELAEAFEAYRKDSNTLGEELADIVIYLLGIAEICGGIDLGIEINKKMYKNERRVYKVDKNGVPTRIE